MIFLQGWGALVGLIGTVLIGAGLESMTGSRAASYAVAGLALAAFGWWLTTRDDDRHAVFWIPIQYLGLLIAVGALVGL